MWRKILRFLLVAGMMRGVEAQVFSPPRGRWGGAFYNQNFFYDREYSNFIADGYTLAGHRILAAVRFRIDSLWFIQTGADVRRFWGVNSRAGARLHFALIYRNLHHKLIIGDLDGRENHRAFRPILAPERVYLPEGRETGIQYIFSKPYVRVETWLDWHRFIRKRDTFREIINWGLTSEMRLWNKGNNRLRWPLQVLIHHRGGQINLKGPYLRGKNDILSVLSLASGLQWRRVVNPYSDVEFFALGFWHTMNSARPEELGFAHGTALWMGAEWFTGHWNAGINFWAARQFSSPLGEDIFQTSSRRVDKYFDRNGEPLVIFARHREARRQLWITHLRYHKCWNEHLSFRAKAEWFYQPYRSSIPGYAFLHDVVNHTDLLLSLELNVVF